MKTLSDTQFAPNTPSRFGSGWVTALLSIKRRKTKQVVKKTTISQKNYQGRHNQETHTTLYNIAHPSQGRGGQNQVQASVGEFNSSPVVASVIDNDVATAYRQEYEWTRDRHAELSKARAQTIVGMSKLYPTSVHLMRYIGTQRGEYANGQIALYTGLDRVRYEITNFQGVMRRADNELRDKLAEVAQLKRDYGENSPIYTSNLRNVELLYKQVMQYEAAHILLLRKHGFYSDTIGKQKEKRWFDVDFTAVSNINWDGVHHSPPSHAHIAGTAGKPVMPGIQSRQEITEVSARLGIPDNLLQFSSHQTNISPNAPPTAAWFEPNTNRITIFPAMVNAGNNTTVNIRGVMIHEFAHIKYQAVSVAARFVADLAKQPPQPTKKAIVFQRKSGVDPNLNNEDKAAKMADLYFTPAMQKTIKQPDFLGTAYEQKLLQTLTNPKSVMNVDKKTGIVTAKNGFEEFVALLKTDGITDYSASYWRAFTVFPSQHTLRMAINETLAAASQMASIGKTQLIPKGWLAASQLMDSVFAKLGSPTPEFAGNFSVAEAGAIALDSHTYKTSRLKSATSANKQQASPKYFLTNKDKLNLSKYEKLRNSEFHDLMQNNADLEESTEINKSLKKAISAHSELLSTPVYRAIKNISAAQLGLTVGLQLENNAWQSATRSKRQAQLLGQNGVIITLVPKPTQYLKVLDMMPYASDKDKQEVLLPPKSTLIIKKVIAGNGSEPDEVIAVVSFGTQGAPS